MSRGTTTKPRAARPAPAVPPSPRPSPSLPRDDHAAFAAAEAAALAALEREDAAGARARSAGALRLAVRLGDPRLEGRARAVYGRALGWSGSLRAGLAQLDRATRLLEGEALAAALVHAGALLYKKGDPAAALGACRRALELLPPEAHHERGRALNNLGVILLYLDRIDEARAPLAEAERLHLLASMPAHAAQSRANLAMALSRLGDLMGALRAFDAAERDLRSHGLSAGQYAVARAEVLLEAGLLRDVRHDLPPVVAELDRTGMQADAAEGQLYLALAHVAARDAGAAELARDARARFHRAGSPGWEAIAGLVEARARWVAGDVSEATLASARRAERALARRRLQPFVPEAELLCGRMAEALGRPGPARRSYALVAEARRRGPVRRQLTGWEALARLRAMEGNRRGALRAAGAGLRVVERHRHAFGAADLRAGASAQGVELAALALLLAVESGDARAVLRWAERWRAGAMYRQPLAPSADPVVANLLRQVREIAVAGRETAVEGRPLDDLERRLARAERALCERVRLVPGPGATPQQPSAPALDLDGLRDALGGRILVEYVECGGRLAAVVVDGARSVLRSLGPASEAARLASATTFALRKLARLPSGSPAAPAALRAFRDRLEALGDALVTPLRPLLEAGELVVVPTGRLHAVPWPALLGDDRVVAVAPSAGLWWRAAAPGDRRDPRAPAGRVVLAAGPGLPGARREIEAVRRSHAHATVLTGAEATVTRVTAAMDGADLVHLAAHGDLRRDNPLFSSFRLADGPQTVYDLERLAAPPAVIVLSACNSGLSQVDAGDELLGLAASLLSLGTRTAVAAVLPLPDLATVPLMVALHRRLAAGDPPGRALAAATAGLDPADPGVVAARSAFACLGAA